MVSNLIPRNLNPHALMFSLHLLPPLTRNLMNMMSNQHSGNQLATFKKNHIQQPVFKKNHGLEFQEKSRSTAGVQEKSRPGVEFQEKSQPADHFQEKSLPADDFQEKSRSKADVSEKLRAGKINRPESKMFTSSSAASATAFSWWRRQKPLKIFSDVLAKKDPVVHLGWVKLRPADDFQEKSRSKTDVLEKLRAGKINRRKSKTFTSSPAASATAFSWWRQQKPLKIFSERVKSFSLQELQVATDNFSNKKILGRGGFGEVYKGRLADGLLVAVKRLNEERTPGGELRFLKEVEMTRMPMHRNLLRLHGFCMTPTKRLLVYPYMANGSLASWLRERPESQPPLDWQTRKRIAFGSARGLSYLNDYCDPKIIHRDVKAANILLDEEFEAVVGDFGLAKSIHHGETHVNVTTAGSGTIGHIAPECLSTGISLDKADVFGYGIMLLELITGKRASDLARLANDDGVMLLDWVKGLLKEKKLEMLVDPDLRKNNNVISEVEGFIQLVLLCTRDSPVERPNMSKVVRMLHGDLPIR